LFLIFINDLIELLKKFGVSLKLFADDVKIYAEIVDTCRIDNCSVPWTAKIWYEIETIVCRLANQTKN